MFSDLRRTMLAINPLGTEKMRVFSSSVDKPAGTSFFARAFFRFLANVPLMNVTQRKKVKYNAIRHTRHRRCLFMQNAKMRSFIKLARTNIDKRRVGEFQVVLIASHFGKKTKKKIKCEALRRAYRVSCKGALSIRTYVHLPKFLIQPHAIIGEAWCFQAASAAWMWLNQWRTIGNRIISSGRMYAR